MKVGDHAVTWGKGSEAGGPQEGADLSGWRNSRKTSVSEESEQGDGRELVSEQWEGTGSGMKTLHGPEQKRDVV